MVMQQYDEESGGIVNLLDHYTDYLVMNTVISQLSNLKQAFRHSIDIIMYRA